MTTTTVKPLSKPQAALIGTARPGETISMLLRDVSASAKALVRNGHLVQSAVNGSHVTYTVQDTPEVRATNAAYAPIPLADPTAPIPVSELENADEPCGDVGTLVDPEPEDNLPDVQPAKPSPFAQRSSNSPIRDQYLALKADYRNHLMFFRLGDFYELFDADAETAARELDLVLTNRPVGTVNGKPVRVPMCGVPYHSVDQFIDKLTAKGFDVVVVEQVREPDGRGLVERQVSRVIDGVKAEPTPEPESDPYPRFAVDDKAVRKSDKAIFDVTLVDGDYISGVRWYAVEKPNNTRAIGDTSPTKKVARIESIERVHRKHFSRQQADQPEPEQPADPHAWATPEIRAEVNALLEKHKVYPMILEPSSHEGTWLIEDEWTVKTMRRTLDKLGVEIIGELAQDWNGDEPYCVARFRLPNPTYQPYPSKRQTKPTPDYPSIFAQYDELRTAVTTRVLIQVNGDEWAAYHMTATLTKQYLPGAKLERQTVNQKGEQWDKLTVPADQLNALIKLANADGVTVALASIVKDEAGKLPERAVTEVHYPDGSAERIDVPDDETTPDEAEGESAPVTEPAPVPAPKLEITPERQAAIIKRRIMGGLRLGRVESVSFDERGEWFVVTFTHSINQFTLEVLETEYEIGTPTKFAVGVHLKVKNPLGDVFAQTAAVLAALPEPDEQPDEPTTPEPEAPAVELLSFEAETTLITTLMSEYPELNAACPGPTEFFLNVIARMRAAAVVAVGQPF